MSEGNEDNVIPPEDNVIPPKSENSENVDSETPPEPEMSEPEEDTAGNVLLKKMKMLIENKQLTKEEVMNVLSGGKRKRSKRRRGKRSKRTRKYGISHKS